MVKENYLFKDIAAFLCLKKETKQINSKYRHPDVCKKDTESNLLLSNFNKLYHKCSPKGVKRT